ncbi:hypothetical protein CR513_16061, partial [Mucuna pruriens]
MVPTPAKQKALKKLPRNRTWDCEYDIYSHLQKKNRVLRSGTEKFNYFNTLLQHFVVKDPKGDPELVQFMDGFYSIVQSQMLHLQELNIENTAEENNTDNDDDDDVTVDPQHKYFLDHLRPHGISYVLDIPEDGVFEKYEPESAFPYFPESAAICRIDNANHVSNEEVNVCLDTDMHVNALANYESPNAVSNHAKHRGRKQKGTKLSSALNGNVKSSDVASKAHKHACNLTGRRRSKRLKMHATKTDTPSGLVIVKIEDSDDEAEDIVRGQVEHCWQEYGEANARTLFRDKLIEELKVPYCEEEHERLLQDITVRKPVQHHKDLRGRIKIYEEDYLGLSFLDYHVDLAEKIETAHDDHPRVLNLLRGFFYWLKNLAHEGAFMPWKDASCLDVLPQQKEGILIN